MPKPFDITQEIVRHWKVANPEGRSTAYEQLACGHVLNVTGLRRDSKYRRCKICLSGFKEAQKTL